MITGIKFNHLQLVLLCGLVLSATAPTETAAAQQYLGNARQRCQGPVTVVVPNASLTVRSFEARSVEITNPKVSWQCRKSGAGRYSVPAEYQ